MNFSKEKFTKVPYYSNCIIFDCETGGLDHTKNPILSIAAIYQDYEGNELGRYTSYLFHERKEITIEAMETNKIPNEIIENSPDAKIVIREFIEWMNQYMRVCKMYFNNKEVLLPKTHCVGYNLFFDLQFIESYVREFCPDLLNDWKFMTRRKFDVQQFAPVYKRQTTLKKAGELYKIENKEAHTALGDVLQTAAIYHQIRGQQRLHERLFDEKMKDYLKNKNESFS